MMPALYDKTWPDAQRIRAAVAMIAQIQLDIPAGTYSQPGRPNCQSVLYILTLEAAELDEAMRTAPDFVREAIGLSKTSTDRSLQ